LKVGRFYLAWFSVLSINSFGWSAATVDELLDQGDSLFNRRAEDHQGSKASPNRIGQALVAYRAAWQMDRKEARAAWQLMRGLLFAEHYVSSSLKEQYALLDEGRRVSKQAVEALRAHCQKDGIPISPWPSQTCADDLKKVSGAAEVYYYSGSLLAEWARVHGAFAAAKSGAAAKIRDFAQMSIWIDDQVRYGGGYRMLGRLHHMCPRIPFVTRWISKKNVLPNLEKSLTIDPRRKYNRLYYAEALYDLEPAKRPEAITMLQALVTEPPDGDLIVEDLQLQADAAKDLEEWTNRH
jgi:hypothetical protein